MAPKRKKQFKQAQTGHPHYLLPGVGDGLVDPDFDNLDGIEAELRESVGHRGGSEDQD